MFSKLAIAVVASLAVFAAAAPASNNDIHNSCNAGQMYCCNDTYETNSSEAKILKQIFNLNIPANTKVGATCSPITGIVGIGNGSSCNQQPVCCTGNDFHGAVVVGCSPVNVNL